MTYPIAIEPGDREHAFGVVVPDLPGCFSAADSMDQVMESAREAILLHMEGMVAEGIAFPAMQPLENHMANPDFNGWIWAMIEVDDIRDANQTIRVNVTLPKGLLSRIDTYASSRHLTRSGFLADAARRYLNATP
ncbi:MAG: type II toxin-antitoxin system HicB family antitoxin [Magnetococcales bacterium]|nr:type II toxin-antitoxin system HicB family antitoxin [Magnetococcales bacterium]